MRRLNRGMIAATLLLPAIGAATSLRAQVQWNVGDVFAAVGGRQYKVHTNAGGLNITISDGTGGVITAGCAFDSAYRLVTTNFSNAEIVRTASDHAHPIVH